MSHRCVSREAERSMSRLYSCLRVGLRDLTEYQRGADHSVAYKEGRRHNLPYAIAQVVPKEDFFEKVLEDGYH